MKQRLCAIEGPVIIMADFNIIHGFSELRPFLDGTDLVILSDPDIPTFTFHRSVRTLDICLCSSVLVERIKLQIIPQPFSDHAALLLEIQPMASRA